MATLLVRHRVRDYDTWRRMYDSDSVGELQKAGGVIDKAVLRAEGDPHLLMVYHRFGSMAEAHAFMGQAALREAMISGGVEEATVSAEFYDEA